MKRGLAMAVAAAAVVQVASLGVVFADTSTGYDASSDSTISVGGSSSQTSGISTGNLTFQLQEGIYQTLGLYVPHDYVWFNALGVSLLALDPPKPMI